MLHSTRSGKPHSGANERLIGGRNLEKYIIVIRGIRRTSREKLISCNKGGGISRQPTHL
jgi:hypothetical protein